MAERKAASCGRTMDHMMPGVERYVIRGGREGYDRLTVLAQARWPDTSALLNRAGVRRICVAKPVRCHLSHMVDIRSASDQIVYRAPDTPLLAVVGVDHLNIYLADCRKLERV